MARAFRRNSCNPNS